MEETLRALTAEAAYNSFDEEWRGELCPGQVADLTVFDGALDTPEQIVKRKVLMSIVAGRFDYYARTAEQPQGTARRPSSPFRCAPPSPSSP